MRGPFTSIVTETTLATTPPEIDPVQAKMADLVSDSFLIQCRFNINGTDDAQRYVLTAWDPYLEDLANSGMRYIRSNIFGPVTQNKANTLNSRYGYKFSIPVNGPEISERFDIFRNSIGWENVICIEGWNEYGQSGWNAADAAYMITHQAAIWNALEAEGSAVDHVDRSHFTPWGRSTEYIDSLVAQGWDTSKVTAGNIHYYNNGRQPTIAGQSIPGDEGGSETIEVSLEGYTIPDFERLCGTGKMRYCTESGWRHDGGSPTQSPVSEDVQAIYMMQLRLELLRLGFKRIVSFELLNNNRVDNDYGHIQWANPAGPATAVRKVYYTDQRLCELFNDPGATFTPGALSYELSGAGFDGFIRHDLYQKRDGTYLLALWRDVQLHKRNPTYGDIDVGTKAITVTFGETVSDINSYRPFVDDTATDEDTATDTVSVSLPRDPMILEITV